MEADNAGQIEGIPLRHVSLYLDIYVDRNGRNHAHGPRP
jgi:hypothetical protein